MTGRRYKLGLKLWSTNLTSIPTAKKLIDEGKYDYVELFTVPGTYDNTYKTWQLCNIPFVVHAAHFAVGMDLSDHTNYINNNRLLDEARNFADRLKAEHLIFHPGVKGNLLETAEQLSKLRDPRALIENVPFVGIDDKLKLLGSTPMEIGRLLEDVPDLGFCLDLAHAVCASNSHGLQVMEIIDKFLLFKPKIIHLSDSDLKSTKDQHLLIGQGNLPIKEFLSKLPAKQKISVESSKELSNLYVLASQEEATLNAT